MTNCTQHFQCGNHCAKRCVGTKPAHIPNIIREGLNERCKGRGYFGYGNYLAEDAGKADQYVEPCSISLLEYLLQQQAPSAHDRVARSQSVYCMVLCRAALGYTAVTKNGERTLDGFGVWAPTRKDTFRRELAMAWICIWRGDLDFCHWSLLKFIFLQNHPY